MAVLAAVAIVFAFDKMLIFYFQNKNRVNRIWPKVVTITVVILFSSMILFRFGTVYGRIPGASVYYSTSDPKALEAGLWLKNNYPGNSSVVVTEVPGFWFRLFSGKTVIAATNPVIHRNEVTTSVLDLSYEVETSLDTEPQMLLRAYEAKGATSYESFVSINHLWKRVVYTSGAGDFVLYNDDGAARKAELSSFSREIDFENETSYARLLIRYISDDLMINQTITVYDDSYPTDVSWTLSPLRSEISDISLYVTVLFDLQFRFEKAYIPGVLDWENPWKYPTDSKGTDWAVTDFSSGTLTDKSLGFYDETNDVAFSLKFEELPDWGNVGALASMQIDAVRLSYNFYDLSVNENGSFAYKFLSFSLPAQPIDVGSLFDLEPASPLNLTSRDYHDYIQSENIGFIVYDKNQLDTKIIRCKLLELIYSNDRYVIFKIKNFT